jgi:GMP synthase (glutamine-hydrolysing)
VSRVLVVEHEAQCPPAHLGTWLTDAGAELEVCRPWAGDEIPAVTAYDGLVVMGGSMGANDDATHPWLTSVKEQVLVAAEAGVPTLGLCLGHQLVAVAFGGAVEKNARGQQVGLFELGWTDAAADDPLLGRLGPVRAVQWNDDVVTALPEGAVALAQTPAGELQAARFAPTVWGVQVHPEVDVPVLTSWAAGDRDDHLHRGIDQEALLAEIEAAREELDRAWRPMAEAFAAMAAR